MSGLYESTPLRLISELIIRTQVPGSSGANLRIHEVTVKD